MVVLNKPALEVKLSKQDSCRARAGHVSVPLHNNLVSRSSNDLRHPAIGAYRARHADGFARESVLDIPKLWAVTAPDQHSENLPGIGLVQINKGGLAFACGRQMQARYFPAYGCNFADVIGRLRWREVLLGIGSYSTAAQKQHAREKQPALAHLRTSQMERMDG